jgi:hypothetical protein
MRMIIGLISVGLVALAAPVGGAEPMTAAQVARALGFDRAAGQRLLAGEIVTTEREETTATQLAVTIGIAVEGDPDALATAVLDSQTLGIAGAIGGAYPNFPHASGRATNGGHPRCAT